METKILKQNDVRKLLNEELLRLRLKNPSYSLRAFAKKLSLSPSALSEIMNGKRNLTAKQAIKMAERLSWTPDTLSGIQTGFQRKRVEAESTQKESAQLTMDQFHAISDWYHFAILSLAETQDFQSEEKWIADRLGISKQNAAQAIARLERLGMLEKSSEGRLIPTGVNYSSSDEVVSLAIRKNHAQNLELAKESLEKDSIDVRDFTSITMAIDLAKLPQAKKMIREFHQKLSALMEDGEKKEVYKFSAQLMPVTRR